VTRRSSPAPPRQPVGTASRSAFRSLRNRNYRLFFSGQSLSQAGTWMQNIAIGWAALELSHSGVVLGVVTAARAVPMLLLGTWGGLIADRTDNRRMLVLTQTTMGCVSLLLAVLSATGMLNLVALISLCLALGLVNVVDNPTRQSLISQLVSPGDLPNAIALNSVAMSLSRVLGPSAGGLVIAAVGVSPCFFGNAVSFAAVIVSLLAMNTGQIVPAKREVRAPGQIRSGLRYVRSTPELLHPMIMIVVTGILAWEFPVTLPLITTRTFGAGAAAYGTATAAMGIGSVVGGLIVARRVRLTVRTLCVSSVLWGAAITLAAAAPALSALFVLLVLVGGGSVTFNSMAKTLLQLRSKPEYRGRVVSLWSTAWLGGPVLGAPLVGWVGSTFGARSGLLTGGIAAIAIGVAILVVSGSSRGPATDP
jgi:MFS family permease